jgi:DNA-binding IscR family transcriptional regulator
VRDVVEALEGPVALAPCGNPRHDERCPRADRCATERLWKRLSATVRDLLDAYTLQDLVQEAEARA